MRVDVKVDPALLILRLQNGSRRFAYAVVNAINKTARRVQEAEAEHVRGAFTIRRPAFFFGTPARPGGAAARIRPFASVGQSRPFAEIAVAGPKTTGAVARETLLARFEEGGTRPIFTPGAKRVAVPLTGGPARPTITQSVPRAYGVGALRLHREGPEGVIRGRQRSFVVRRHDGGGAILQRTGPGDGEVQTLYVFARPARLDRRLRFEETARRVSDAWFAKEVERETVVALAKSRGRGL